MTQKLPGGERSRRAGLLAALVLVAARAWAGEASDTCLTCHAEAALTMERGGHVVPLFVKAPALRASVHATLECTDCHQGFDPSSLPHAKRIGPVSCASCHTDAADRHTFHAAFSSTTEPGGSPATDCTGCHGSHAVARAKGPDGAFSRARQLPRCGACHGDAVLAFERARHGRALIAGVAAAPDCVGCHAKPVTATREPDAARRSLTQEKLCLSCHLDDPKVRERVGPGARFIAAYETSVHGRGVLAGNGAVANCVSCHGAHRAGTGLDPDSTVSKAHIPETCARCHGSIAVEYAQSVHGKAVARGVREAPVCTDCHGEHDIYARGDPKSPVAPANVSAKVCTPCHASLRLSDKFEIASDRSQTFADSYHGLALRGGSVEAANCASCHGAHGIRPSSDPESSVNKANLAATCGKCHPDANARFAVGQVHVVLAREQSPALWWIATLYIGMIVATVGGMFLHNALDFFGKFRHRLRAHREGAPEEPVPHALYLRMALAERLQHAVLVVSFVALAATGFMLRSPESWWVVGLRRVIPRLFDMRTAIHRGAAVAMIGTSLFHIGYAASTRRGRKLIADLFPRRQDLLDVGRNLAHQVGLRREKPKFPRFSYVEKSEYWALVWGTIVMAVTGAILWFDNTSMGLLTKLGSDIARTVHFYEAVLATLAIIVWHLYWVILNPDVYPMSFAWLTGYLTEREMAEEHALELAEIRRARARRELDLAGGEPAPAPAGPSEGPGAG